MNYIAKYNSTRITYCQINYTARQKINVIFLLFVRIFIHMRRYEFIEYAIL